MDMSKPDIEALFREQRGAIQRLRDSSARQRIRKLRSIQAYLFDRGNEKRLAEAMYADLRKSRMEVVTTETGPVVMAIRHICKHLADWMRTEHVPSPMNMSGLRHQVVYQSKGNCLIMSPWNYPLQLAVNPLVHAIAAGNPVIMKPSEISAHTTGFLAEMMKELFPREEVAVVQGEVETATQLLELPFHHIYFTGSPQVGRIVMAAAARQLASVTLELGGKSPAIVDASVNLKKVAGQTAWAKTLNTGQTCIAPDYLLLEKKLLPQFTDHFAAAVERMYNREGKGISNSPDYGRIINARHFARVKGLLDDALAKGAQVAVGGKVDEEDRFIAPTLLTGVTEDMEILQEEIFGPILPVLTWEKLEEVPEIIARRPRPLSFYIMSRKRRHIDYLIRHSSAGGTVVNEYMVGSLNPNLPFGGVNESGIGKANGFHSFVEFSNPRGVVRRTWGTFRFLYPPFSERMPGLVRFLYRYF
jgi:aldehyde dehydrogenase (NAD+)